MRTLKKSLALVLAIVLVVGVCVFNAAAFTDDEAITCDEAVAVLTGIGVIKGRDTGAFDPTATLTRAEAATIITRLKGQEDLQAKSKFDDMHGHWAESYVAYCAAEGIVNGVGDNKFDPDAKLTGNQWGKMLLVAMGFDPAETGLDKGDTWEVAVAKLVKEKKLKVGVETLNMNNPISRENTCVLAFNALGQSVSGNKTYVASDGETFDNALEAYVYKDVTGVTITVDTPSDSLQANFPTLAEDPSYEDDFGRPGHQWTYGEGTDNKVIYTEVDAATYSYVADESESATMANINAALKRTTSKTKLTAADDIEIVKNGEDATDYSAGDIVEIYASDLVVSKVVITHYDLAFIDEVKDLTASELKALKAADEDDPSTQKISFTLADETELTIYDGLFADFDYDEEEYVLVAMNGTNTEVMASQAAESVSGTVDAKRASTYRINGAYYAIAADTFGETISLSNGTEGVWALNAAGEIAGVIDVTASSTDYAMVYNVRAVSTTDEAYTGDGYDDSETNYDYTVYAVLSDGTKVAYPGYTDKYGKLVGLVDAAGHTSSDGKVIVGEQISIVAYEIKDGKFLVVNGEYNIGSATGVTLNKQSMISTGRYANNSTVYIKGEKKLNTSTGKYTFNVSKVTGYRNAVLENANISYVYNGRTVLYVFTSSDIVAEETSESLVAVLTSTDYIETVDSDETIIYTYSVIIDGEAAELEVLDNTTMAGVAEGDPFLYLLTGDGYVAKDSVTALTTVETISYVSGNQVMVGSTEYDASGAQVYVLKDDEGELALNDNDGLDTGKLKANVTAILATNTDSDGNKYISYAFIVE